MKRFKATFYYSNGNITTQIIECKNKNTAEYIALGLVYNSRRLMPMKLKKLKRLKTKHNEKSNTQSI